MAIIGFSAVGASKSGDVAGFESGESGALISYLRELGHEVVDPASSYARHFVSLDHHQATLHGISGRIPVANRTLIVLEPRVVKPRNYRLATYSQYGSVLSFTHAAPASSRTLPWPQKDWRNLEHSTLLRLAGTTSLINANKYSNVRGSLYGLRRRVIQAFSDATLPLVLAGSGWDRTTIPCLVENAKSIAYAALNRERIAWAEWAVPLQLGPSVNYLGRVDNKAEVLEATEFAIVIENSATYVSEKLFDAVIAGCVPLYVGPPLSEYGIPEDVAVELSQDPGAFTKAVRGMGADKKAKVLRSGREWLEDEATYLKWAMPHALRELAAAIDQNISRSEELL